MRLGSTTLGACLVFVSLVGACGEASSTTGEASSTTDASSSTTDDGTSTLAESDASTDDAESSTAGPDDLPPPDSCEGLEQLADVLADEPDPGVRDQLVDAFVATHSYGEHGFPLVEGTRLCLVHEGAPGEDLSVTGDFDGWDPSAHPLTEIAAGIHYGVFELDAEPSGLYKLTRAGQEFFADPLARRFGWDEFGEYSQIDALPGRSHHERWLAFDQAAGALEPRTVTVWLPADAALDAEPGLPVLYMHDGQNLFAPDALFGGWRVGETLDEAIGAGSLPPLVVVGVDNTAARFDEYTQVTDLIDGVEYGGRADEYAAFLVDGIKPFIEARYSVASAPDRVAVMGSSLGGLVSLYIGLQHPEVFGSVASMSGTVDWGSLGAQNPTILDAYLDAPPLGLRVYLDSGGDEGLGCPDDGSDNYCGNVSLANALRGLGWVDEDDLIYRWAPGAPHNEAAWADRLLPALLDWFPG